MTIPNNAINTIHPKIISIIVSPRIMLLYQTKLEKKIQPTKKANYLAFLYDKILALLSCISSSVILP